MLIRFWGVRGSIPCPGPDTMRYGGNTTCFELRFADSKKLVIIDAGSGIRPLADKLMRSDFPKGPIDADIFISHTHWDHIMGFPFFTPIYIKTSYLRIHGPVSFEDEPLEKVIGGQLRYRYFPVRQEELSARIEYQELKETRLDLGDGITITTKYLNHPILCLGYRFEQGGKVFCTCYDTEPFRNMFPTDPKDPDYDPAVAAEGEAAAAEENQKYLDFIQGADVVVHDTQYTLEEYKKNKIGWGHSTFEHAVNAAHKAAVKKLVFFHHDPLRTDDQLDQLLVKYRGMMAGKTSLEVDVAREGMEIEL